MCAKLPLGRLPIAREKPDRRSSGVISSLPQLLVSHLRSVVQELAREAAGSHPRPVLLFGAGQHTWWLLEQLPELLRLPIVGVIDSAAIGLCGPWPTLTPEQAASQHAGAVVVLSTDLHQTAFTRVVQDAWSQAGAAAPRVIDLYAGLPAGPYHKPSVLSGTPGDKPLLRGTEKWLRRTIARVADYVTARRGTADSTPVLLLGQSWQTSAAAEVLTARGVAVTTDPAAARVAITCDEALEPNHSAIVCPRPAGFTGEMLTLRRGERPWINRTPGAAFGSEKGGDTPLRIVIRHDHNLGDVILSQGILPERLKTELYPRCHITFVTARYNWRRPRPPHPNADDTGWCVDICRHNPYIDRVVASDQATPELFAEADLVYTIDGSGDLLDHVSDFHVRHVELPPGRTDATIHLCEADKQLAQQVIAPLLTQAAARGGPVIGVNMGLTLERFRGWSAEKVRELCQRIEQELSGTVVWFGWTSFDQYQRLMHAGKPLSARQQAAVMARCDVHITSQGGGANMSAAVGCPTLALTGLHPCWREGVAYLNNHAIDDPSRRNVEIWRQGETLVVSGLDRVDASASPCGPGTPVHTRHIPWSLTAEGLTAGDPVPLVERYMNELWQCITPVDKLPRSEPWWWRTRDVTVDDVMTTLRAMLAGRTAASHNAVELAAGN